MAENGEAPDAKVRAKEDVVVIRTVAEKVPGTVKWFSLSKQYGFIQRDDKEEDIFVHRSSVTKFTRFPCLWSGLKIECSVVETNKGFKADNVTGPGGEVIPRRNIRPRNYDGGEGGRRPRRTRRPRNGDLGTGETYYDATGSENNGGGEGSDGTRLAGDRRGRFRGPGWFRRRRGYGNRRPDTTNGNEEVNALSDGVNAINIDRETNGRPGAPGPRRRSNRGRGPRRFGRAGQRNIATDPSNNEPAESNEQAEFVTEEQTTEGTDQKPVGNNGPRRRRGGRGGYMNNRNRGNGYQSSNASNSVSGVNGSSVGQEVCC